MLLILQLVFLFNLCICGGSSSIADKFLFFPPKFDVTKKNVQRHEGEIIFAPILESDFSDNWHRKLFLHNKHVKIAKGKAMYAHYKPVVETDHSMILLHGNAEDIHQRANIHQKLSTKCNCHVFAIEYPGYSELQNRNGWGNPAASQGRLLAASRAALRDILQTFPANKAIFFGYSIGTGIAIDLAAGLEKAATVSQTPTFKPLGLILVAPYTDIQSAAKEVLPTWLNFLGKTVLNVLDNREKIKLITVPTLYLHGERDTLIHSQNSEYLAALQKENNQHVYLKIFTNANHDDNFSKGLYSHTAVCYLAVHKVDVGS